MKKTLLIALFLGCLTSFASAGMKAGVTASGYQLDAQGKEAKQTRGDQARSEDLVGATLSLFAEYSIHDRISVGVDVVPYDIDMGSVKNVRNCLGASEQANCGSTGGCGTNSASVDMQMPVTGYLLFPSDQGYYLKAGYSMTTLKITESLTSGTSYPDEELFGYHINVGYEHDFGEAFVRAEVGVSDWEEITVKSSSNRTSYTADLDGVSARISIGKAF